jgi:hypothetical protein
MHVLAIYAVNEHIADLMAEAAQQRRASALPRKPSRRSILASRIFNRRRATHGFAGAGA